MISELLDQAITIGALRPLDIHFAGVIAKKNEPDILLAAACLSAASGAGHVCLTLDQLEERKLFEGRYPELAQAVWLAIGKPDLVGWQQRLLASIAVSDGSTATPLVLRGQRLYLQRMWQSEREVAVFITKNLKHNAVDETRLRAILDRLFGVAHDDEPNWQKIAAAVAVTRRVSVISGGPGTGKTTTVAKLLAALIQVNKIARPRIQLAAPTGKAATRLSESLGIARRHLVLTPEENELFPVEVKTMHRLLGIQFNSRCMRYNSSNPLHLDILVVDEASMLDLPMMACLMSAMPKQAQVIFLGDRNQLSSVESGAVLGDLCKFAEQGYSEVRAAELSRLTGCLLRGSKAQISSIVRDSLCLLHKSYRFHDNSGISKLAHAVNLGNIREVRAVLYSSFNNVVSYSLENTKEYHRLLSACVSGYRKYFTEISAGADAVKVLKTFSSFQVLCALRLGPFGISGLNQSIESQLRHAGLIHCSRRLWYLGRPVMISENDSALELYNGDIGIALLDGLGEIRVYFRLPNGSLKSFYPGCLPKHETVYAMTVHKSQGSEFEHAVLVLPNYFLPLLTRELVYTAITRARNQLSLYATERVLLKAVCTPTLRRSGLFERLLKKRL